MDGLRDLLVLEPGSEARRTSVTAPLDYTKIRIMVGGDDWSVVFYTEANGESPVETFLRGLDQKTYGRFIWSIEQLRLRNVQARAPLVRHLEGKIWELREGSQTNIYRLLYFFFTGRKFVFLHGFQKKSEKTPRRELEIAEARMQGFIRRVEGGERS